MHRITNKRMAESPLRMFSKLCGDQAVKNVVLVTTMWNGKYTEEQRKREKEVIGEFEKTMKNHSVSTARFLNSLDSAQEIIDNILRQPDAKLLLKQPPSTSPLDLLPIPPPTPQVSVPQAIRGVNTQLPRPGPFEESQTQANHLLLLVVPSRPSLRISPYPLLYLLPRLIPRSLSRPYPPILNLKARID